MKSTNLLLIAEGFELIRKAYEQEAKSQAELEAVAGGATGKVKPKAEAPTQAEEVEAEEEEGEANEVGVSLDELNAMTLKQLKELAVGCDVAVPKDTKKADIVNLIAEALELTEAEEAEEAEEEVEAGAEEADEEADEEAEELTIADVEDMNQADLKELAAEYEVDLPKGKFNKEKAVQAIVKALFEKEEIDAYYNDSAEEDEEAEAEAEEELTPEDLAELTLTELKALAKEYGVTHPKMISAVKLRTLLEEQLFDDGEDETDLDLEDKAKEYGLDEMSVEELTDLLVEHEIKAKGNKEALIARVLEAIEDGTIEVEDEGK